MAISVVVLNDILAIIAIIFFVIYLKKNKQIAIFFFCAAVSLVLFAHVLIKLSRTSLFGWLVWGVGVILMIIGVINFLKGLKTKKT